MLPEEASVFVREVLAHARGPESDRGNPYFPFSEETCRAIIAEVSKKDELRPRVIMHAFSAVLQEADPRIEAGEMKTISVQFATHVLAEYVTLVADDQGEED
jgi:hypothetical protein